MIGSVSEEIARLEARIKEMEQSHALLLDKIDIRDKKIAYVYSHPVQFLLKIIYLRMTSKGLVN